MRQHHFQLDKLSRLSTHLEELCALLRNNGQDEASPELTDEVAATAGEIMLLLADHGQDELVCGTLADARHLRDVARSQQQQRNQIEAVSVALMNDVARIIHAEKRAA